MMTGNKEKNFKREKCSQSTNQRNQTRRQRVLRQELYEKEAQMVETCEELVKTYEKLQVEIRDYPDVVLKKRKRLNNVLSKLSEQAEEQIPKTIRLAGELKKVSQAGAPQVTSQTKLPKEKSAKKNRFETVVFYSFLLIIVMILSSVLSSQAESGRPKNIAGYSPMTVLTRSMQSVYPQHSLVITKVTEPKELKLGEDITYIKENNTTVTHRIVGVNENYMGTGKRGFETKGVENPRKDEEVVRAENVIGKVVFSSLILGEILLFVQQNMILTAVTVILFIYLSDLLIKYSVTQWSSKRGKQ